MTFIDFFRKQFVEEGTTTRNMLSRIPNGQFAYKPHERSMDMKRLAVHLADLPGWIQIVLTTDELDFEKPYEQPDINSNADLMAYFEQRYAAGLAMLVPENEQYLQKPWTLRNGATIYSVDPKMDVIRMALSQQIHHRAQLGVYLRLLNISIPGSYGPSADENHFQ